MKTKFFLTMALLSFFGITKGQIRVYDKSGNPKTFQKEETEITFLKTEIAYPNEGLESGLLGTIAPGIIPLLPSLVDIGFNLTTSLLEKEAKKYSGSYFKHKSYLEASSKCVPKVTFSRDLDNEKSFGLVLIPHKVPSVEAYVFYIDSLNLQYSKSKIQRDAKFLDYTIEIKITEIKEGKKEVIELAPVIITSVGFGVNKFKVKKHRTEMIPLTPNSAFAEISINIVESNPYKVKAEDILKTWNENKDSFKTIVNNILPSQKAETSSTPSQNDPNGDESN